MFKPSLWLSALTEYFLYAFHAFPLLTTHVWKRPETFILEMTKWGLRRSDHSPQGHTADKFHKDISFSPSPTGRQFGRWLSESFSPGKHTFCNPSPWGWFTCNQGKTAKVVGCHRGTGKNKMWSVQTMEYYSVWKRKKIPTHATTRINLQDISLSEINQLPKAKYL